ncbi:MAG: thioredoxin domain-containing protein, partial [Saprospiraceae bacterium]|nr:thioredoxin domain-containing protein [Saprospiraceae bacterium]
LTDANGGFYSSLDADSEGEEGKFYVWKKSEIDSIIGVGQLQSLFNKYYRITEKGNWEEHKNILHTQTTFLDFAKKEKQEEEDLAKAFAQFRGKLLEHRATRVRPGLDDKILSSWNALMLVGYLDAYKALRTNAYLEIALQNGEFLKDNMIKEDFRMDRNFKNGKSTINGFLDDYALTIQAFIELYQATFNPDWLIQANGLAEYAIKHFSHKEDPFFNYKSDLDPPLVATKKELGDNVIPGSNSAMAKALYELGTLMYKPAYIEKAKSMIQNMAPTVAESETPNFFSNWLSAFPSLVQPPYEVAILGEECQKKRQQLQAEYLPNVLLLGGKEEGELELLQNKLQEGSTMIYVCQNKVCKFPVEEASKALTQIDKVLK